MATMVKSYAVQGIDGYPVDIETTTMEGMPMISIIGLGDQAVKEAGERIRAAVDACGYVFPKKKIIINLAPGDKKKKGTHFDLAMAVSLLQHESAIGARDLENYGMIGELSLNGMLRPCRGIISMIIAAKKSGMQNIIVPKSNLREAKLVHGIKVWGFENLIDVIRFLEGKAVADQEQTVIPNDNELSEETTLDFKDVKGQDDLIEAVVLAAAGGHNMLMIGEPGCGKTMIAQRILTILPEMTKEESLEVSLAHNGVLFLDELAEFSRKTLDALRQPIEDKKVCISRVNTSNTFPSNFMFVAALNPCPCGYYPSSKCHCTDYEIIKYRGKISGPILDRIDIQKEVHPVDFFELKDMTETKSSKELREQVVKARKIQQERYKDYEGINSNAQMTTSMIQKYCSLDEKSLSLLKQKCEEYGYSARVIHKLLRLARTSADLDGSENIRQCDVKKVLSYRDLDQSNSQMMVIS